MKIPSAIILAAGKSERMGTDKLFLKHTNGKYFIEHIADEYFKFGCEPIIVVVNATSRNSKPFKKLKLPPAATIITNGNPDLGRFYSLQLALKSEAIKDWAFVHNIDNPFCSNDLLKAMMNNADNFDYLVPSYRGKGGHPILISKCVATGAVNAANNEILNKYLKQFRGNKLAIDSDLILLNINTMSDYLLFLNRLKE